MSNLNVFKRRAGHAMTASQISVDKIGDIMKYMPMAQIQAAREGKKTHPIEP